MFLLHKAIKRINYYGKERVFNTIEEARAYLNEAPVLLEKAKKGKKMRGR